MPASPFTGTKLRHFGDYEILEEIARGGMGVVFKARQVNLNRVVALKLINSGALAGEELIKRFKAEAEAAATLNHPNIVPIHEIGAVRGQHYFSMGLVQGPNLDEYRASKPLPPRQAAQIALVLARTVHHAHQHGILHRDIKPSNVLIDRQGVPYLTDFGLAKIAQKDSTLTYTNAILGTPSYMAPEQARGQTKDVTTAADVYGLGAVLYACLTGHPPFAGGTTFETIRQVLEQEARPPSEWNRAVDRDLETICLKALAKEAPRRYASAAALAQDLEHWLNLEPIEARPATSVERLRKWVQRRPAIAALGTLLAISILALSVGSTIAAFRINQLRRAEALHRQKAEAIAIELRRKTYAAEINVAFQALAENNLERALELVNRQEPGPGEEDLRGFEWRYLWSLCLDRSERTFADGAGVCLAYAPDGQFLVYCGGSRGAPNEVIVRDAHSHQILTRLPAGATSLSFSSRTNLLASADAKGGVKLWNTKTWREVATPLPGAINPVKFSPDGRWLLTGAEGHLQVQLWDTENWRVAATASVQPFFAWPMNVAFSPDSRSLLLPVSDRQEGFQLRTVPDLQVIPGIGTNSATVCSAAFTADGKHLLTAVSGGALFVWDVERRTLVEQLSGHSATIWAIAFSPDGAFFATGGADRKVRLWDAATRKPLATLRGHFNEIFWIAFSSDSRTFASIEVNGRQEVKLWSTGIRDRHEEMEGAAVLVGVTPGLGLCALGEEGLKIWNLTDSSLGHRPLSLEQVYRDDYHLSKNRVALASAVPIVAVAQENGAIELSSAASQSAVRHWRAHASGDIPVLDISSDGKWLATGCRPGEVKLWDVTTSRETARFGSLNAGVLCVRLSPDGQTLAASTDSASVLIWDLPSRRQIGSFNVDRDSAASLQFSPNGELLAATRENDVFLWAVRSRRPPTVFKGHLQEVRAIAFSPDGRTLATGSDDQTLKLWHLSTLQELTTIPLEGGCVSLKFSPNGRVLACGLWKDSSRATTQLWRAPSLDEIATASR